MRNTRPFVLLALAVLLAPRIEASRTSVWESNPPSSLTATKADAAGLLVSLAPAAAADAEITEALRFNLGDVVLDESALEHEDRFNLGPLELLSPAPLRGPPPSYPETRVRGFELLAPFRVGASAALSLWPRQACGFVCREVVSDSRYDPLGLAGEFGAEGAEAEQYKNRIRQATGELSSGAEMVNIGLQAGLYVGPGISGVMLGLDLFNMIEEGHYARAAGIVAGGWATIRLLRYARTAAPELWARIAQKLKANQAVRSEMKELEALVASRPRNAGAGLARELDEAANAARGAGPGAASVTDPAFGAPGALRRSAKETFRENLIRVTGYDPKNTLVEAVERTAQAHHVFPQKFRDLFRRAGIDVDNPYYGAWWEGVNHNQTARAYNAEWEAFFSANPNPTSAQVTAHGRQLAERYGFTVHF